MNFTMEHSSREICKFNLRGMCRFGARCWNLHENPHTMVTRSQAAKAECATSSCSTNKAQDISAPSTSRLTEALSSVNISDEDNENDKVCGICFDTVVKKVNISEQTFGILPNCNHCFCYTCIRKWRQSKEFEFEVSKGCPECRIGSDYVYPSKVWLEQSDQKKSFIKSQNEKMKKIHCRYFRRGKGLCPFGNTCVYQHALPNGTVVDVGKPKPKRRNCMIEIDDHLFLDDDDDVYLEDDDYDDDSDVYLDDGDYFYDDDDYDDEFLIDFLDAVDGNADYSMEDEVEVEESDAESGDDEGEDVSVEEEEGEEKEQDNRISIEDEEEEQGDYFEVDENSDYIEEEEDECVDENGDEYVDEDGDECVDEGGEECVDEDGDEYVDEEAGFVEMDDNMVEEEEGDYQNIQLEGYESIEGCGYDVEEFDNNADGYMYEEDYDCDVNDVDNYDEVEFIY